MSNKPEGAESNASHRRERYGDIPVTKELFLWTPFYGAIADKLLLYRDKRDELIEGIHSIKSKVEGKGKGVSNLQDKFRDGSEGPLRDICPFTVMGIFNRGITDEKRKNIATELANFLGVKEVVPDSFEAIPKVSNHNSWFFGFEKEREPDDIDALWELFAQAIIFSNSDDADNVRANFISAYDSATKRLYIGWKLTIGLYWIRPWNFPNLDKKSRHYIEEDLNIKIKLTIKAKPDGPKKYCNASDYLAVLDELKTHFKKENYPVHSFPEVSHAAWVSRDGKPSASPDVIDIAGQEDGLETSTSPDAIDIVGQEDGLDSEPKEATIETYSVDNIISDGCFLEQEKLETILKRLQIKKNLILQGPPGTGKTWLAKRLAFALIEQKNNSKVKTFQFHPNLSYEDFIQGWRPSGDGKLALVNGPFVKMISAAKNEPSTKHVIVIEEINRGNPAQIFGEMLTLLEVDKRTQDEALELSYHRDGDEPVFIPENLYVIGTMNIADRSLALVDLALRRRFAFIDLKPMFGKAWEDWMKNRCNIDTEIVNKIKNKIVDLNKKITSDSSLGEQFSIGHSYVTPPLTTPIHDAQEWFRQVVNTEIGPLLNEYWFDSLEKAEDARKKLLDGF